MVRNCVARVKVDHFVNTQIGTNFLLLSFTLLSLLIATLLLSKGVTKDRVFYSRVAGLALGCFGTLLVGVSLLSETGSTPIDLTNDPFSHSRYLLAGRLLCFFAIACQPLMFCALRVSARACQFATVGLALALVCFLVVIKVIALGDHYLLHLVVIHSFTMAISLWLLIEIALLRKSISTSTLSIMVAVVIATLIVYAIWVVIILLYMFEIKLFALTQYQMNQWDQYFRFLRGSLFIVSEIVLFVFWLQTRSSIALTEAKNKESIFNLLTEKDKLISHLVNTRALVETGALSAGVAHELNQFLARIQINSEEADSLIEKDSTSEQARDSLVRIQDSVRAASEVITGIKKLFSKTDSEFSKIKIDQFLAESVDIYSERARQAEVSLDVSLTADCEWLVSETLLRQVMSNLVSNAIESLDSITKPEKKILIKSCVRDKCLCIDVIDNGPGVASNKRQNLFSLFATTKKNGAGVGLWLSKSIIEQHAGRIYYAIGLEGESIFSIELPNVSIRQSNTR